MIGLQENLPIYLSRRRVREAQREMSCQTGEGVDVRDGCSRYVSLLAGKVGQDILFHTKRPKYTRSLQSPPKQYRRRSLRHSLRLFPRYTNLQYHRPRRHEC